MSYSFEPGMIYRMPTHFGPGLGPRQGPEGCKYDNLDSPKNTSVKINFLTNRESLEKLLPPDFTVDGEPLVSVEFTYMKEIPWLAGRGYNIFGVTWPAIFNGTEKRYTGKLLSVLWENLADPIITGREELGYNKIYCELPEPIVVPGQVRCLASWLGFQFAELSAFNLKQLSPEEVKKETTRPSVGDGMFHYKYIPRSGEWGQPDVAYATITPIVDTNTKVIEIWKGDGHLMFLKATWEELPTLVNIVNTFAGLEIKEYRGVTLTKTVGAKDLSDVHIIR